MSDVYRTMNNFLLSTGYNKYNNKEKLKLINEGLRIYLTEKIKEKNPNDKFINGYTQFSVETLLIVLEDDNITNDVIHYLINCVSNIQGFEIIWYISDDNKDKDYPIMSLNDGKIDSLTTSKDYNGPEIYKFIDDSFNTIYKVNDDNSSLIKK